MNIFIGIFSILLIAFWLSHFRNNSSKIIFDIGRDFSINPSGRYGQYSGEELRKILVKLLTAGKPFIVDLDYACGYSSSFLEEAFRGLITKENFEPQFILSLMKIKSDYDSSLILEITEYIKGN